MPALRNIKHETFAQHIAKSPKTGFSQGECYTLSGFRTGGRSADACAARLLTDANIQARISEIVAPAVKKSRVSVESLLSELETTIADAREAKQHAVVVNALGLSARLCGMLRDRLEIGGVGEFDNVQTVADVGDAMLREMDAATALEAIDAVRARIELQAANQAADVSPVYRRQDETAAALKTLRNGRRR